MLRLYNTLTRKVEEFQPLHPPEVGMYACGLTVYNYAHIGNLRTYIFEDILKRALIMEGYTVKHVMNVTDVGHLTSDADTGDDKMEKGAAREGKSAQEIADFYWQHFRKDLRNLNIIEPDAWPKATETIGEQIDLVRRLEEKDFTYRIADGIYFDSSKLKDYGKLARLDIEGLQAGARICMVEGKRRPTDFALWKFTPPSVKRAMEWDSPWGRGFPGWHIECTAMAMMHFGDELDIHCGGIDHIGVHHTNEIAQAEAVTGKQWVRWWMHGAFLVMPSDKGQERMSKSGGDFVTLDTLIERGYDPLAYRYFCLNAHYRSPLAFSWEALETARQGLETLKSRFQELRENSLESGRSAQRWVQAFRDAVREDLNMPKALAVTWDVLRDGEIRESDAVATVQEMDAILGLGLYEEGADATAWRKRVHGVTILLIKPSIRGTDPPQDVEAQVLRRAEARKTKDFATSDSIREELAKRGFVLEDTPGGTRVKKGDDVWLISEPAQEQ
jgi:cysteinyl-tRNA synthetase